jgi:2-dehydropantoate 2-reductase
VLAAPTDAAERLFSAAAFNTRRIEPIEQGMWEKWVVLAAMAGGTCLMRGSVGSIVATDEGRAFMQELIGETAAVATAAGYPPDPEFLSGARGVLTASGSAATASMFRDIAKGGTTEGAHIIGQMLRRARELGIATPLLRVANVHLQTYEIERRKKVG